MKSPYILGMILFWNLIFLLKTTMGQTVIFTETMGIKQSASIAIHEANDYFDNDDLLMTDGGATKSALVYTDNPSTTPPTYSNPSGRSNIYFGVSSDTYGFAIENINASGYSNLRVQFGYRKEATSYPAPLTFQYWNGIKYNTITFSFNEANNAGIGWYLSPEIFLPPDACTNGLKLRWLKSGTTRTARIDDVRLMGDLGGSLLEAIPNQIAHQNTVLGQGPSPAKSFTLSGESLNGSDVTIQAPVNFEVSLEETDNFNPSLVLPAYDGAEKTIWVRLKDGLDLGLYEGQIYVSGGNAPEIFVDVSGTVVIPFDIPFHNAFTTAEDYYEAVAQEFEMVRVEYVADNGGCLEIPFTAAIYSPVIDLLPHSSLNVSFQTGAPLNSNDLQITCSIIYDGNAAGEVFLIQDIPGNNGFQTISQTIYLDASVKYTSAKLHFEMTSSNGTHIWFKDLSVRDLTSWEGGISSNWEDPENWSPGLPGIKSEVVIFPSANNPSISGAGEVYDLTLLENTSLTINPGGMLTVGHLLVNQSGAANLVVEDGGSLIHPNADVPATVNRNLAAANWNDCTDGWHLVSSPVEDQLITGEWATSGTGNDYDFYAWSEPQQLWLNQKETNNEISRFVPGEGYLLAYQQGGTKAFAGELTVEDITRTLTLTEGEDFSGWNLLGNPYASGLLWNHDPDIWGDFQAMNVNAYANTWDCDSKSYVVVPPGGFIPAGQGFMVQLTNGASAGLVIPAAARAHESPPVNKSEISGWIKLAAFEQDNASKQESLLMVNPSATETFQPYWDAHFLQGFAPQFYSLKGDEKLAVFSLPEIDMNQVIPFGFVKNEAEAFRVTLLENNTNARLFLYDRKLDTEHPLQQDNPYLFTAETDDDPLRFELRFKSANSTGIGQHVQEEAVEVYAAGKVLYLKFPVEEGGRTMEVFDPRGRLLLARPLGVGRQHSISLDVEAGVYIVRIKGKQWTVSKKIFVI